MFCTRCKNHVAECECGDIEERLEQLANHENFATDRCKGCHRHPGDCTCDEYVPLGSSAPTAEGEIPTTCPDCGLDVGVDTGVTPDGECSWCGQTLVADGGEGD